MLKEKDTYRSSKGKLQKVGGHDERGPHTQWFNGVSSATMVLIMIIHNTHDLSNNCQPQILSCLLWVYLISISTTLYLFILISDLFMISLVRTGVGTRQRIVHRMYFAVAAPLASPTEHLRDSVVGATCSHCLSRVQLSD